jgi:ATP-dependent exoDNAse (exonuclease V) alpha subunit
VKTTIENELNQELIIIDTHLLNNFSYCYAYTGHSIQGQTKEEPIVICDYNHYFVNKEWLYVALTRNKYFNLYSCKIEKEEQPSDSYIKKKIESYKIQDMNAGRKIENDYIDVKCIKELFLKQRGRCACCGNNMNISNDCKSNDNWVVDRIGNAKAHITGNCQLLRLSCNASKK